MSRSSGLVRQIDIGGVTIADLVAWSDARDQVSERISLYLPTHRAGREVAQDPVRFRGLVGLAAAEVDDAGVLAAAVELSEDRDFWAHGTQGLAVLVDRGQTTAIRLHEPVTELAVASDRFHLKPLVAAIGRAADFEVLALSRHLVRLVHVTSTSASEVEVADLPASLEDALRWDDRERQLHSHAGGRVGSGHVTAAFHGQGNRSDAGERDLERFARVIDRALAARHRRVARPLVLAGVGDIVAAFRSVTRHPRIVDDDVTGNTDHLTVAALADQARGSVRPAEPDRERRAREAFARGSAATIVTVEQAIVAADAGQVASIFVPADVSVWGRHRTGHALLVEHEEREPGDHDLTDVAAMETLRHGGEAYVVPPVDVPGEGAVAATLHY